MPPCHCNTHQCNGSLRTYSTVQNHQAADQRARFRAAAEAHQTIIDEHDDELAAYISSVTLSEDINTPPSTQNMTTSSEPPSKSSRTPIQDSLTQIEAIERDVELLTGLLQPKLQDLPSPSKRTDPFPLFSFQVAARQLRNRLNRVVYPNTTVRQRKGAVSSRLKFLIRDLADQQSRWDAQTDRIPDEKHSSPTYATDHHFAPILEGADHIVQLIMFAMTVLDVVLNLSRRGCHFVLFFARYLVQLTLSKDRTTISSRNADFVAGLPVDPDTVMHKFNLDGKATIYAVCPRATCHKTYAPTFAYDSPIPQYPKFCTHQAYEDGPLCGTALTQKHKSGAFQVPIKRFISFSFKDYISGLLSRSGLEKLMDNPLIDNGQMRDVFDGEYLRTFTDMQGNPFVSSLGVGRYSFSLGVDFFNPLGNKQAGKKSSVGVLTVVCLNLPVHLRYKTENMFLAGVIPGPKEPPLDAINHYLTPLVDEFGEFWSPGVRFSRTQAYPEGRLVLCALILIICDLVAARKAAGFASFSHEHFCSVCDCRRSKNGYNRTDYHVWQRRTNEECRAGAERFRSASDEQERQRVFNETGMRWSELLRLPYLDITRCLVVDSMHNLFLGLLKEHFTKILGIGLPDRPEQPALVLPAAFDAHDLTGNDCKGVKRLKKLLETPVATTLPSREEAVKKFTSNVTSAALKFACAQVQCIPSGINPAKLTKAVLAGYLFEWRSSQREDLGDASTNCGHVLEPEDMEKIWSDLAKIVSPSWMTSVPSDLGKPAHGKLKADQWRVLGTVHLPLSLTRLWGNTEPNDPRSIRRRKILDVTMSLLSAVRVATSHTMTATDAETYLQYMLEYLEGIKALFPDYQFLPNHHMSLHIHEFLLLFGPVHSWWTFPFERLIGVLQRMPHNFQPGQYEETMARAYTRASNLRAILVREGCPEIISNCEDAFKQLISPENRNSLETMMRVLPSLYNMKTPSVPSGRIERKLPSDILTAFNASNFRVPSSGYTLSSLTIRGLTFSVSTKHLGNSCIIISTSDTHVPAQICHIAQFDNNRLFLVIRRHKRIPQQNNTFAQYGGIGATLWSPRLKSLEIVEVGSVVCHFAYLPIMKANAEVIAVLPLWRGA